MRQIIKRILTWLMGMIRQNARHTFWKRGITEKQAIARGVRRFFQQNYELRYNVMKQTEEFRPKNVTAAREKIPASRKKIPASRKNVTAARYDNCPLSPLVTLECTLLLKRLSRNDSFYTWSHECTLSK